MSPDDRPLADVANSSVNKRPLVYCCSLCGWAFHDPTWDDIEAHWKDHVTEAANR